MPHRDEGRGPERLVIIVAKTRAACIICDISIPRRTNRSQKDAFRKSFFFQSFESGENAAGISEACGRRRFAAMQLQILSARDSFGRGRKAHDRIGAHLLALVVVASVKTGGLADAPANKETLIFDPKKFTVETVTVGDCKVAYRAYEGIVYVTNPVDPRIPGLGSSLRGSNHASCG
jgi:hypothetical protein